MEVKTTQLVVLTDKEKKALMEASDIIQKIYYELNLGEPFKFEDEEVTNSVNEIADFVKDIV